MFAFKFKKYELKNICDIKDDLFKTKQLTSKMSYITEEMVSFQNIQMSVHFC